jgi:hypothetical protein
MFQSHQPEDCLMDEKGYATCKCGSAWFRLVGRPEDPPSMNQGAVALDETGMITAYAGRLVCIECGETKEAGARERPLLKLMDDRAEA